MKPISRISKMSFIWISLILAFAFFATVLPQPTRIQAATCVATYTVVSGDTLSAIALKYNTTIQAIAAANDLKEPYTLTIGQKLCIPAGTTSGTPVSTPGSTPPPGSSSTNPSFSATFSGRFVTIKTTNYPRKNFYSVNGFLPGKQNKYIVGYLNTSKSNTMQQTYQLPKDLRNVRNLTICLKNRVYDNVQCNRYSLQDDVYNLVFSWYITYTVERNK
jgi:murein DD-endopeptidase MepM/ murein hydrolase activator NlpD